MFRQVIYFSTLLFVGSIKPELKKTELEHSLEKAYDVKLKAPIGTVTLDDFLDDTRDFLMANWQMIVILLLAYVLYFFFRYIKGVHERLDTLEQEVKLLVNLCQNRNNTDFNH